MGFKRFSRQTKVGSTDRQSHRNPPSLPACLSTSCLRSLEFHPLGPQNRIPSGGRIRLIARCRLPTPSGVWQTTVHGRKAQEACLWHERRPAQMVEPFRLLSSEIWPGALQGRPVLLCAVLRCSFRCEGFQAEANSEELRLNYDSQVDHRVSYYAFCYVQ